MATTCIEDGHRLPKQALKYKPKGWRNIGRPRKRWRDQLHLEDQGTGNTPNPSGTWWWCCDFTLPLYGHNIGYIYRLIFLFCLTKKGVCGSAENKDRTYTLGQKLWDHCPAHYTQNRETMLRSAWQLRTVPATLRCHLRPSQFNCVNIQWGWLPLTHLGLRCKQTAQLKVDLWK